LVCFSTTPGSTTLRKHLGLNRRRENATLPEAILTQMATYQMDLISKIAGLDNRITRLER